MEIKTEYYLQAVLIILSSNDPTQNLDNDYRKVSFVIVWWKCIYLFLQEDGHTFFKGKKIFPESAAVD